MRRTKKSPATMSARRSPLPVLTALIRLITIGAAGFAHLGGGQWRESRAAIILNGREAFVAVRGDVKGGPAPGVTNERNGYNVFLEAPPGLDSINLSASPPPGKTTIPGASAIANSQVNTTITLSADNLLVSSAGFASESVSTVQTATRATEAEAGAQINFNLQFTTDRAYDYVIDFSSELVGEALSLPEVAAAAYTIGTNFGFHRDLTFAGGTVFNQGPLVGRLQPGGNYFLETSVLVDGRKRFGGSSSANADYQFTFELLTPFVRWADPVSGVFQDGDNWSSGVAPSAADNAMVDRPGTYTVSLNSNTAHRRLDIRGDGANVTLDLEGHRYQLEELHLGDPSGNFSMTLGDSSGIAVAVPPGESGPWPAPGTGEAKAPHLDCDRPGKTFITAKTTTNTGSISKNHIVSVQANGFWDVHLVNVGRDTPGTMEISNGGTVKARQTLTINRDDPGIFGDPAKVIVGGFPGDPKVGTLEAQVLSVGFSGSGELEIKNRGEVSAEQIDVGTVSGAKGVVIVNGETALLKQTGSLGPRLNIGSQGKGTLAVIEGRVEANKIVIGAFGTGQGIVNVVGGRVDVAGELIVGDEGKGELNMTTDASPRVRADHAVIGPMGKVTVDGGILSIGSVLTVNGELSVGTDGFVGVGTFPGLGLGGTLQLGPGGHLKGDGIISADLDLAGGIPEFTGSIFEPANSTGTMTIEGNVVQEPGSALEIEIGGTDDGLFDVVKVTGDVTLGGDLFLKFTDGFSPRQGDQFEFLDVTGTLSVSFAKVAVRNLAPGFQFNLQPNGGGLTMVALSDGEFRLPTSSAWNEDASGRWSSVANWTDGDPNHAGVTAVLGNKITAPRSVTVDEPITVGRIDFDNANAYTIAGESSITLDATTGDAQINVTSGSHIISAPVTLADNTVITVVPAAGSLSLTGALSAGALNVTKAGAGRLTLANVQTAGLTIGEGTVALASTGAAAGTSVVGALTIAGGATSTAKLDLANNAAIVDFPAAGPNPEATIRDQIISGRGGSGLGKTWDGLGITSSQAAADPVNSTSVGYAVNGSLPLGPYTTFRGEPVDNTSVLMAYTRTGDANLDGIVNNDDVTIVGASYAPGFPKPHWALGDFDYNGFVDNDDVTLLGVFYNPNASPIPAPAASDSVAAIPEPTALALSVCAAIAAMLKALRSRRVMYV